MQIQKRTHKTLDPSGNEDKKNKQQKTINKKSQPKQQTNYVNKVSQEKPSLSKKYNHQNFANPEHQANHQNRLNQNQQSRQTNKNYQHILNYDKQKDDKFEFKLKTQKNKFQSVQNKKQKPQKNIQDLAQHYQKEVQEQTHLKKYKQHKKIKQIQIQNAINNPLLFQQNNPLISQSISLLNSRLKKSFGSGNADYLQNYNRQDSLDNQQDYELQKDKSTMNGMKNKNHQKYRKQEDILYDEDFNDEQYEDQLENIRAVKQFERQIEEKYKISVANKIYTFPRVKITSILDILSSDEQQQAYQQNEQQQDESERSSIQYNPFKPSKMSNSVKVNQFGSSKLKIRQDINSKSRQGKNQKSHNFKKIKQDSYTKGEKQQNKRQKTKKRYLQHFQEKQKKPLKKQIHQKMNQSLKFNDSSSKMNHANPSKINQYNSSSQKAKNQNNNPSKIIDKIKLKVNNNTKNYFQQQKYHIKQQKYNDNHKNQRISWNEGKPKIIKKDNITVQKANNRRFAAQRLKTQIYNGGDDSSQFQDSLTQSRRILYEKQFFVK